MTNLITVPFHNQNLVATLVGDIPHVAMKPICESIGLDWASQFSRIKRHPVLKSTVAMITMVADDGKAREMLMLPIEYLNGWLFGIDANKVKESAKENVIEYQKECFRVLANHFMPAPINILTTRQKEHIQTIVSDIAYNKGIHYGTTYRQIKKKFDVARYDELTKEQYPLVCAFFDVEPEGEAPLLINNNPSIAELKQQGYLVIKRTPQELRGLIMDNVPSDLLPGIIDTAWMRLKAINFTKKD